ncbi:MAG: hypothetical protein L0H53_09070 [Candidatus Nitrosocosmicus sp.]|nr:hypothetical protein [Candidatus Nitrosocosmicus sp.]MDN5868047.1 hypothetical protein [Candidatus Nitrosocosmicus sp.]
MRFSILPHYFYKSLVLCFTFVLVLSFQIPNYSYSSTDNSNLDNSSMQISENSDNNTALLNLDSLDNSTANTTGTLTPDTGSINLDLPDSILDLLGSAPPLADQQNITENLTNTNNTMTMTTNETQLSGTENVAVIANFSSKPMGLETDYAISGKPIILVDNTSLNYEYMNDPSDEITISDMLVSLRANIKLDNSTTSVPLQLRVFSNPTNVTENADGSRTYINNPTAIENLEIGGVIFSETRTIATVYSNGTGTLNSTNIS